MTIFGSINILVLLQNCIDIMIFKIREALGKKMGFPLSVKTERWNCCLVIVKEVE